MPWKAHTDLFSILGVFLISFISGFISVAQRIARGHATSVLWVVSELLSAVLCGYIMYDAYPNLSKYLPEWCSMLMMICLAAHVGGRGFQELEKHLYSRFNPMERQLRLPPNDE